MKNNQLLFKKNLHFHSIHTMPKHCPEARNIPFIFNNGFFFSSFFHKQNNSTITFKAPWMLCVIDVFFFLRRISEYPKILSVKIHIKGGIVKNIQTDCSSFHLKFQRRVYNAGSIFGISELKSVFYIPFFFLRHFRILWLGIFFHSKPHKKFTIFLS